MKKVVKILIIVAAAMSVVGILMILLTLGINKWDITLFNNKRNVEESMVFDEDISRIEVDATAMAVKIHPSQDDECRVDFTYLEGGKLSAEVENGTLRIDYDYDPSWFQFNISFEAETANIYLPEAVYESLVVNADAGKISVDDGVTFTSCDINTAAGAVEILGDILDEIKIDTSAGAVELTDISCDRIDINTSAGSIRLNEVTASSVIEAETSAGSINLNRCSGHMILETSAGSISGTVVGDYEFDTDVSFGNCHVPNSVNGAPVISASTSAGTINIECE